jgi:hypothetical protein
LHFVFILSRASHKTLQLFLCKKAFAIEEKTFTEFAKSFFTENQNETSQDFN